MDISLCSFDSEIQETGHKQAVLKFNYLIANLLVDKYDAQISFCHTPMFISTSFARIKCDLCLLTRVAKLTFLQRHVLSLDGPVVTASGFQDQLAVVTHVSECLPSNDQVHFDIFCLLS